MLLRGREDKAAASKGVLSLFSAAVECGEIGVDRKEFAPRRILWPASPFVSRWRSADGEGSDGVRECGELAGAVFDSDGEG